MLGHLAESVESDVRCGCDFDEYSEVCFPRERSGRKDGGRLIRV